MENKPSVFTKDRDPMKRHVNKRLFDTKPQRGPYKNLDLVLFFVGTPVALCILSGIPQVLFANLQNILGIK